MYCPYARCRGSAGNTIIVVVLVLLSQIDIMTGGYTLRVNSPRGPPPVATPPPRYAKGRPRTTVS
ncbi:hypothetical protein ABZZ80_35055 [Streptomyces sp. NPDC006356]